jgi:hypothetical protein
MSLCPQILLAGALLSLPLVAQTKVYVPSNSPGAGTMNLAPLGGKALSGSSQNMRTQVRIPRSRLPAGGSQIQQLAFSSSSVGSYRYSTLVVQLAHFKGTKLTTNFANNVVGPETVFSAKAFVFSKADTWSWIKLDKVFDHDGKSDLVVDIVIQGARYSGQTGSSIAGSRRSDGSSGLERIYALSYSSSNPAKTGYGPYPGGPKMALDVVAAKTIETYGTACKDSQGKLPTIQMNKSPAPGLPMSFSGGSSGAIQGSFLLFGVDKTRFGTIPLPLKLDTLGGPGCWLEVSILLVLPGDKPSGTFSTQVWTLPKDPTLVGIDLYGQWLLLDPKANRLGLVFSQGLRARIVSGP